ncbi:polyketide beta-ketoacyl synthase [[Actinomadura] parvosata subsp. kistnae]|uniref:Polyketide beta-ketoacyl synthase n=1 Tax=[Actinomadura] parvosata subsp. kistnae TaxID=1909395 RepID=A0A1U9ZVP1_9ACTN|nr:lasso peptide biosynthesis B2 protein [Nonomuraea sp. ATCC 55076]AQZ62002.1 polyketide beta-ketoacyl synthase [Nonomuraea sp. ATCC 55076]
MSVPSALERPQGVPWRARAAARVAVAAAFVLALLPPNRLRAVLRLLRHGARPATYAQAKAARDAVLAVSLTCLGVHGCLPRSLATTVLCRLRGSWPTWCSGVRMRPPFAAHAWVEAEGTPVEETVPDGYLTPLITVGPRHEG